MLGLALRPSRYLTFKKASGSIKITTPLATRDSKRLPQCCGNIYHKINNIPLFIKKKSEMSHQLTKPAAMPQAIEGVQRAAQRRPMNGCETPCYGRDKAAGDTTRDTTTARINRAVICDKRLEELNKNILRGVDLLHLRDELLRELPCCGKLCRFDTVAFRNVHDTIGESRWVTVLGSQHVS